MSSVTFAFTHAVTFCASIDQAYSMYIYESQVKLMPYVVEFCLMVAVVGMALTSKLCMYWQGSGGGTSQNGNSPSWFCWITAYT